MKIFTQTLENREPSLDAQVPQQLDENAKATPLAPLLAVTTLVLESFVHEKSHAAYKLAQQKIFVFYEFRIEFLA